VNLKRIDLADEDDKKYGLDRWCKLFKAETWENMKMIAEKRIREQCRAREEWLINDQWKNDKIARQNETIGQQRQQLAEKDREIEKLKEMLKDISK